MSKVYSGSVESAPARGNPLFLHISLFSLSQFQFNSRNQGSVLVVSSPGCYYTYCSFCWCCCCCCCCCSANPLFSSLYIFLSCVINLSFTISHPPTLVLIPILILYYTLLSFILLSEKAPPTSTTFLLNYIVVCT